ncbi:MAG: MBL fold metallo-hydrolase [Brevinemataceae bacterium]
MIVQITPHIYQIQASKPSAHSYLIKSEKNTLIDTGIKEHSPQLKEDLLSLDLRFDDINDIIFTHCHYDHTGGGDLFKHATIYAHPLCRAKLFYQDDKCIHALTHGAELPTTIPSKNLSDGDLYQNGSIVFQVIHTPGHSDDSICLYNRQDRILISGDTVFASGIPALITESGSNATLITSLEKLIPLSLSTILPGHGKIDLNPCKTLQLTKDNIINRIQKLNAETKSGVSL